ncbi:MAG: adenosylcobalamin-dependent ribonucleoside-diphosphate reductase [Desulfobacterales bacterium]|nr:adenosylcobalamin-dependent ribonucleoside-diphosphate reductase [Desulfobacterales bacterium]
MAKIRLTPTAEVVLKKRYLSRNRQGEISETPECLFHRVAHAIAVADVLLDRQASAETSAEAFEEALTSLSFLPNTPCLINAGKPLGQLSACFVLPIEDSLESIFEALKETALIHQSGGGTGFSFSRLRPHGDTVRSTHGVSSGPVSFMRVFDMATETIKQGGARRGANMGVLHVSHPDIEEFIRAKEPSGQFRNFNLSVAVDDIFIDALKKGNYYPLIHPRTGSVVGRRSAKKILEMMAECAWESGDPGILFIDTVNRTNPTPSLGKIEATNPCGEQPLLPYESCTLGSINLTKVINGKGISYRKLKELVHLGVHFLDNVVEVNRYPIRQIEEMSKKTRKIGLGVMGFADTLILLGIPYQSKKAVNLAEEIMSCINECAVEASIRLAEKRGNFPAFGKSIYPAKGIKKRRNATLTTVAPTGTISLIAGVSSGIEPVFAFSLKRRIIDSVIKEIHPIYERYQKEKRPISEKIFQTAWDIPPEWHLKVQAAFQKYTESAVSKTVNFPASATPEGIEKAFLMALDMDLKGVTVYRDKSRPGQTLAACSLKSEECD